MQGVRNSVTQSDHTCTQVIESALRSPPHAFGGERPAAILTGDVLMRSDKDVREPPLLERKLTLEEALVHLKRFHLTSHIAGPLKSFLD